MTFNQKNASQAAHNTKKTCKGMDYPWTLCTTQNGSNILVKLTKQPMHFLWPQAREEETSKAVF